MSQLRTPALREMLAGLIGALRAAASTPIST